MGSRPKLFSLYGLGSQLIFLSLLTSWVLLSIAIIYIKWDNKWKNTQAQNIYKLMGWLVKGKTKAHDSLPNGPWVLNSLKSTSFMKQNKWVYWIEKNIPLKEKVFSVIHCVQSSLIWGVHYKCGTYSHVREILHVTIIYDITFKTTTVISRLISKSIPI